MNAEFEIAALQSRLSSAESKLTETQNQLNGKVAAAEAKAAQAQQQAQQAINWQQTLRGSQGVTVRGNVIEGPPQNQGSGGAATGEGGAGGINVVLNVNGVAYFATLNGTLNGLVP